MALLTPPDSFCGILEASVMMLSPLPTSTPVSSFNQQAFVDGPISEFWRTQIVLPAARPGTVSVAGWRDTAAFLLSLRGGVNLMRWHDPMRYPIRGAGGPFPTISLAATALAGATSISVAGLTASQAIALAADDHFGLDENLYSITAHAGSDVDGEATISFLPPLRKGAILGDSINLVRPTARMRLVGGFMDLSVPHHRRSRPLALEFFEQPDFEQ